MADLISELGIDYIKWDHNRDVTEPVHDGHYGLHAQTEAAYRLFDDLKAEFPGLEIESCASGGGRTDAGILQHADRIWRPIRMTRATAWTSSVTPSSWCRPR